MKNTDLPPTKWTIRRTFMFIVCGFCAGTIGYVTYRDLTSVTAMTTLIAAFVIIAQCIGSYVFGVAWEDIARLKVLGGKRDGA